MILYYVIIMVVETKVKLKWKKWRNSRNLDELILVD